MHPRSSPSPSQDQYRHPLQQVLDAIGRDPALASERRQIQEYVERSLRVKGVAEPARKDLAASRLEKLISEARDEISTTHLLGSISERDKDWLQAATPLLQVLASLPDSQATASRSNLVRALIVGAYARLAPEALVDDIARARFKKVGRASKVRRRHRLTPVRKANHVNRSARRPEDAQYASVRSADRPAEAG